MAKQLSNYLETNNHLSNTRYGFRQNLSTETALTTLTNKLYSNMEARKISLLTLCDLSKAFDSVNHNIVNNKLTKINWFWDYFDNSGQKVKIHNTLSTTTPIKYGVPQGSILGPLLFTIFVNDLAEEIHRCKIIQYADDTQFGERWTRCLTSSQRHRRPYLWQKLTLIQTASCLTKTKRSVSLFEAEHL